MKGIKTTIVASLFAIILFGLIIAFVMKKITMDEMKDIVAVTTPIAILVIGWFAKDANATHSK